jgi:hypothetical protein
MRMPDWLYAYLMEKMADDCRFCLCGCSRLRWSLWRLFRKYVLRRKPEECSYGT